MAEAARRSDIERTGKVFYHTSLSRRPSGHLLRMKKSQQKQERQRHRRSDWETKGNHYLTLSYHKRCYVFTSFSNSALTFRTLYRPDQNETDSVFLSSSSFYHHDNVYPKRSDRVTVEAPSPYSKYSFIVDPCHSSISACNRRLGS